MSSLYDPNLPVFSRNTGVIDDEIIFEIAADVDDVFVQGVDLGPSDDEKGFWLLQGREQAGRKSFEWVGFC